MDACMTAVVLKTGDTLRIMQTLMCRPTLYSNNASFSIKIILVISCAVCMVNMNRYNQCFRFE